jgi:hypothetical protein
MHILNLFAVLYCLAYLYVHTYLIRLLQIAIARHFVILLRSSWSHLVGWRLSVVTRQLNA